METTDNLPHELKPNYNFSAWTLKYNTLPPKYHKKENVTYQLKLTSKNYIILGELQVTDQEGEKIREDYGGIRYHVTKHMFFRY